MSDTVYALDKDFKKVVGNFINNAEKRLNKDYNQIVETIEQLRLENPTLVKQCIEPFTKNITELRQTANSFQSCATFTSNGVSRYLGEILKQIGWIKDKHLTYKDKVDECDGNVDCVENLLPELREALKNLPENIEEKNKLLNQYFDTGKLQICDTVDEMNKEGHKIIEEIRKCMKLN